jgi:hypothetical protein
MVKISAKTTIVAVRARALYMNPAMTTPKISAVTDHKSIMV